MRTAANVAAGLDPAEARRKALGRFGNLALIRRQCRAVDERHKMKTLLAITAPIVLAGSGLAVLAPIGQLTVLGEMLIVIGALRCLLLYVRQRHSQTDTSSAILGLSNTPTEVVSADTSSRANKLLWVLTFSLSILTLVTASIAINAFSKSFLRSERSQTFERNGHQ
jgi:hypothetical protein